MIGTSHRFRGESGVSLVELLVVCVVIAIVAALAFMQRGTADAQFQRQNAARELKVAFERARFDSVKRRADGSSAAPLAYVEVRTTSFTLRTFNVDANAAAVAVDRVYPFPAGVVASGYNFSLGSSKQVQFDFRGQAAVVGGGEPQFMICNGATCPSAPGNNGETNTVLVTPTGTVNLLPGGIAIPSFNNPTIDPGVAAGDGIKDIVVIP
jgi:Tfp pilus assembly protein FimT